MAVTSNKASSGIGGSLILIIFIVLTITVFSVLTLVSARGELAEMNKSAEISESYYTAEKEASRICGEIYAAAQSAESNSEITAAAVSLGADASSDENGVTITFSVNIDERRTLETTLLVSGKSIKTAARKIVSSSADGITIDEGVEIWDGISPPA